MAFPRLPAARGRTLMLVLTLFVLAPWTAALAATNALPAIHLMAPRVGDTAAAASGANLVYHGGSIEKRVKVYLVYWGWHGIDPSGERAYLESFFSGVGGSAWANIDTQYSETSRGAITNPAGQLAGTWRDENSTPPSGVTESALRSEALVASSHFGYDADADYFIATPSGHNSADFGTRYCAWHSYGTDGSGRVVAFTNLPYITDAGASCGKNSVNSGTAGLLDGVSIVAGHEYAEAQTDPRIDAWYEGNYQENADKCAWLSSGVGRLQNIALSTGTFAVQGIWSNAASGCAISYGSCPTTGDAGDAVAEASLVFLPADCLATFGQGVVGVGLGNQNDWWAFPVTSGRTIHVTVTPPTTGYVSVGLYAPSDSTTAVAGAGAIAGTPASLSQLATSTGNWHLRVYNSAGGFGTYRVQISTS